MVHVQSSEVSEYAHEVYVRLHALVEFKPVDVGSLNEWVEQAGALVYLIRGCSALDDLIPVGVWQYLSDVEMRMKDEEYECAQNRLIEIFMSGLKEGVFMSADELDAELDGRGAIDR